MAEPEPAKIEAKEYLWRDDWKPDTVFNLLTVKMPKAKK